MREVGEDLPPCQDVRRAARDAPTRMMFVAFPEKGSFSPTGQIHASLPFVGSLPTVSVLQGLVLGPFYIFLLCS